MFYNRIYAFVIFRGLSDSSMVYYFCMFCFQQLLVQFQVYKLRSDFMNPQRGKKKKSKEIKVVLTLDSFVLYTSIELHTSVQL